jgi:8-oxo-dGTP diphosphatase
MIACHTLFGNRKLIPAEKLHFRPSAYAIIMDNGKVLLVKMHSTGTYCLPGGGVDLGERIEDCLKREVKEETGIEIEVRQFEFFKEDFFYYDPLDQAFHSFMFFYSCRPVTMDLIPDDQVNDGEVETPRWIDIQALQAGDFYNDGEKIVRILSVKD